MYRPSSKHLPKFLMFCLNSVKLKVGLGLNWDYKYRNNIKIFVFPYFNFLGVSSFLNFPYFSGNFAFIDDYTATSALVEGTNYIVATAPTATSLTVDSCGEKIPPTDGNNCACSLNAMVICQQCGAYCHDDCVSASRLCVSCVIR